MDPPPGKDAEFMETASGLLVTVGAQYLPAFMLRDLLAALFPKIAHERLFLCCLKQIHT